MITRVWNEGWLGAACQRAAADEIYRDRVKLEIYEIYRERVKPHGNDKDDDARSS